MKQHLNIRTPLKAWKYWPCNTYGLVATLLGIEWYFVITVATPDVPRYESLAEETDKVPFERREQLVDIQVGKLYWEKYVGVFPNLKRTYIWLGKRAMNICAE